MNPPRTLTLPLLPSRIYDELGMLPPGPHSMLRVATAAKWMDFSLLYNITSSFASTRVAHGTLLTYTVSGPSAHMRVIVMIFADHPSPWVYRHILEHLTAPLPRRLSHLEKKSGRMKDDLRGLRHLPLTD